MKDSVEINLDGFTVKVWKEDKDLWIKINGGEDMAMSDTSAMILGAALMHFANGEDDE